MRLTLQCFFTRENEKCPSNNLLSIFLVFFSDGKYFLSPLLHKSSRAIWSFLRHIFRFYLGLNFVFLGQKLRNFKVFFCFWREKFVLFFLGIFSSRVEFFCFFSGIIFSSRVVFKILSRVKKKYVPLPVYDSSLSCIKKYPLIHTYPYVPFFKN